MVEGGEKKGTKVHSSNDGIYFIFKGRRNVTVTAAASGDRGERRGRIKRGGGVT